MLQHIYWKRLKRLSGLSGKESQMLETFDYLNSVSQLSNDFLSIVLPLLPDDFLTTADDFLTTSWWLLDDFLMTTWLPLKTAWWFQRVLNVIAKKRVDFALSDYKTIVNCTKTKPGKFKKFEDAFSAPSSENKHISRVVIENKTEKPFSWVGCTINDKSYRYLITWSLPV